jgi:hypothetical protein
MKKWKKIKREVFDLRNQSTTSQMFRKKSYVGIKNPSQLVKEKTGHQQRLRPNSKNFTDAAAG